MKRTFIQLSLLAICTSMVASCDFGSKVKPFVIPENYQLKDDIHILFYHTMNKDLQQVLEAYIADFEELYPQITVEHRAIGGYDDVRDQMTTAIAGKGIDADIAYCYPDHVATYQNAGSLVCLSTLIDDPEWGFSQDQINDFVKAYYDEGLLSDGKMYALPLSKSSEVMYYNKTFFAEHSLTVPTTWTEMATTLATIKELEPSSIPLGYDSEANWFITMCEQFNSGYTTAEGGKKDHFIYNNSTNKDFMKQFKSWYDLGYFTTKSISGGYTSSIFTNQDSTKATSYMSIGSSAGASNQHPGINPATSEEYFEVGIARIPQVDLNNGKVISQGPDICIFNKGDADKIMASWLFIKFLTTSVEFQAQFSMTSGYTPVIKSVLQNQVYSDWLNDSVGAENIKAAATKLCSEQSSWYFTSPAFIGSSAARDAVGALFDEILLADDIDNTIDTLFEKSIRNCIQKS